MHPKEARLKTAHWLSLLMFAVTRLRQTDIKAGHYERKVQALEESRDQWETKYEEMSKKYAEANKALEDFRHEIEGL